MVVIRWNRLGQQHGAVWEAGSSMLAFEIDIDVLGGAVVHMDSWSSKMSAK